MPEKQIVSTRGTHSVSLRYGAKTLAELEKNVAATLRDLQTSLNRRLEPLLRGERSTTEVDILGRTLNFYKGVLVDPGLGSSQFAFLGNNGQLYYAAGGNEYDLTILNDSYNPIDLGVLYPGYRYIIQFLYGTHKRVAFLGTPLADPTFALLDPANSTFHIETYVGGTLTDCWASLYGEQSTIIGLSPGAAQFSIPLQNSPITNGPLMDLLFKGFVGASFSLATTATVKIGHTSAGVPDLVNGAPVTRIKLWQLNLNTEI